MKATMQRKLCVVTQPLPKREGNNGLVIDLLKVLEPLADEIFVVSGNFPENTFSQKIRIWNIKNDENKQPKFVRAQKYFLEQIKIAVKMMKLPNDINCVLFYIGAKPYVLAHIIAKLRRKKTIVIVTGSAADARNIYGGTFFPMIMISLEKLAYALADRVVAESKSMIQPLGLKKYEKKIALSGCFFDINLFQQKKSLSQRMEYVGYVGRLSEEKGILNFVDAIPLMLKIRGDLNFIIVGDGQLRTRIEESLISLKLSDKVKLIGWIQRDQLVHFYNELKLLVVPSYFESIPIVAMEAMACGTPVLATAVGGVPDVITDGENGFILKNNKIETIAETVIQVLELPKLGAVAKAAYVSIESGYTFATATEKYRSIFDGMLVIK
jgi:glycosyltransferase involved in cell wall biosynthesis